jgi:hypothetical protein
MFFEMCLDPLRKLIVHFLPGEISNFFLYCLYLKEGLVFRSPESQFKSLPVSSYPKRSLRE